MALASPLAARRFLSTGLTPSAELTTSLTAHTYLNPHGLNLHGLNPHGLNPHGMNPHGLNPHGLPPILSLDQSWPPSVATSLCASIDASPCRGQMSQCTSSCSLGSSRRDSRPASQPPSRVASAISCVEMAEAPIPCVEMAEAVEVTTSCVEMAEAAEATTDRGDAVTNAEWRLALSPSPPPSLSPSLSPSVISAGLLPAGLPPLTLSPVLAPSPPPPSGVRSHAHTPPRAQAAQ